jgi:hypothetical protein
MSLGRRAATIFFGAACGVAGVYFFTGQNYGRLHSPSLARAAKSTALAASAPPPVVSVDELPKVVMRKLGPEELTPALIRKADEVLWKYDDAPIGSEIVLEAEGKSFVARFEQHFHEIGGPKKPWGFHKGVTLYAAE